MVKNKMTDAIDEEQRHSLDNIDSHVTAADAQTQLYLSRNFNNIPITYDISPPVPPVLLTSLPAPDSNRLN